MYVEQGGNANYYLWLPYLSIGCKPSCLHKRKRTDTDFDRFDPLFTLSGLSGKKGGYIRVILRWSNILMIAMGD